MTTVRAVVVNWNSWWFTRRCLASLFSADTSFGSLEVVVVDNGSFDGSLERLRHEFGESVRFIANRRNLGFAEACNRGIGDLSGVDHVLLVNNDAVVEPGCLDELVRALDRDPRAGAAAARMVLEPAFAVVELEVRGRCAIERVEVDGVEATGAVQSADLIVTGRPEWPLELRREAVGSVRLMVPADDSRKVSFVVTGDGSMTVATRTDNCGTTLGAEPRSLEVLLDEQRVELLNGLGTDWGPELESFDRYFGSIDDPAVIPELAGDPIEVPGFCGGGVLLRARMLDDVGAFDPRFFAYYEDTDLARRAGRAGWVTVTAPAAVVRHAFGGSGASSSPGFFFLNYRNWLLASLRQPSPAERGAVRAELTERLNVAVRSNLLSPLRRRHRPSLTLVLAWARVLAGFVVARVGAGLARSARPLGRRPSNLVRLPFQPTFSPRPPTPRPGGPLVVHLELASSTDAAGRARPDPLIRRLLVPPAEVAERIEVVPVVREDDGVRVAGPAEVARALGLPVAGPGRALPILVPPSGPGTVGVRVDRTGWTATVVGRDGESSRRSERWHDAPGQSGTALTDEGLDAFVRTLSTLVGRDC